jgi:hypothetical protein
MRLHSNPSEHFAVLEYLQAGIAHFRDQPAECDFQRGYEQALRDMCQEFFGAPSDEPLH